MTFGVKQNMIFVATHPLVILTKFGQNRMKHVEEEAKRSKLLEERKKERKKSQERNKLGETPNLTRHAPFAKGTG